MTGDRNATDMLEMISKRIDFEEALFTPNISSLNARAKGRFDVKIIIAFFLWINYWFSFHFFSVSIDNMYTFAQPNHSQRNADHWMKIAPNNKSHAFSSIEDVFNYLQQTHKDESISILVTGSLHLIGEVLRTIKE